MEGAGLMIAPVMVVDDEAMMRKSLAQAIERSGAEVITASDGEEALAHQGLRHLQRLLRAAAPDEVHLVMSATSNGPDTRAAVRAFAAVAVSHPLFTHLDETASCASVIDAWIESGLPLSYVGTRRDIPGDLDPAEPRRLIRRTLQGAHTS